jgi:hypothetical protein
LKQFFLYFAAVLVQEFMFCASTLGQSKSEPSSFDQPLLSFSKAADIVRHDNLETEIEFYPLNLIVPNDPVVKNEVMFDYHRFNTSGKLLGGIRFFADANTYWASERDMKDLIMYTEAYYGFKNFQLGLESGSVTGQEYLSIGPQYVGYDTKWFRRVALVTRVMPDFTLGYEFTTQEFDVTENFRLSSTGMGRIVFPSYQTVSQVSLWASFKNIKGIYFGVEYEYNSAASYNNWKVTNHELFLGIKAELH